MNATFDRIDNHMKNIQETLFMLVNLIPKRGRKEEPKQEKDAVAKRTQIKSNKRVELPIFFYCKGVDERIPKLKE